MAKRHHRKVVRFQVVETIPLFDAHDAIRGTRSCVVGAFRSRRKAERLAERLSARWPEGEVSIAVRATRAANTKNPHRVAIRRARRVMRFDLPF